MPTSCFVHSHRRSALQPARCPAVCRRHRKGMPVLMMKHLSSAIALLATPVAIVSGCSNQPSNNPSTSTTSTSGSASNAQTLNTQLNAPDGTHVAEATIDFTNGYATVTVQTVATGILSPGFHGLHVHAVGRCEANSVAPGGGQSADFASAGERFQAPGHTGQPASGDLPPLLVRSDGSGKLVATSDGFTLDQLKGSEGSSIVLDQGADIGSQATGSDKRIACGVLSPASATSTSTSVSTSVSTSTIATTAVSPVPPATVTVTPSSTAPTSTVTPSTSTSTSTVTVIQPTLPPITVPGPPGPNGG
ncbi:MAG: superoxide dismutase, Cu-Zn family [Mycobacterium sp.]|jgi:superoxide dismutase, Cu-Zn family|nr:superoxide dismutase, Cu-Zn family [Mycobacterium sp.]MDT5307190.1 superoxide dismutase, Cu-Zn family [Mycobacterium sp.]